MSSPQTSALENQDAIGDDLLPEAVPLPSSSPSSPSFKTPIRQVTTSQSIPPTMTISENPPSILKEELLAPPSRRESITTGDGSGMVLFAEPTEDMDSSKKHKLDESGHTSPTEINAPYDTISEPIEDTLSLMDSIPDDGELSSPALLFSHSYYSTTSTDILHDEDGNQTSSEAKPEWLSPHTPISQISSVAAEVADTAAMLDATPIEAPTPEYLSNLGDMYAGSPVVELVEETSFTSLSEMSSLSAEIADATSIPDCLPDGRFLIGPRAYITEISPEGVHTGAIRMVRITDPSDSVTSAERSAVVVEDNRSDDERPEEIFSKQTDNTEFNASVAALRSILTIEEEHREVITGPFPDELSSDRSIVLINQDNAEREKAQNLFEVATVVVGSDLNSKNEEDIDGEKFYFPSPARDTFIANTAGVFDKKSKTENTESQEDTANFIPPHLRRKYGKNSDNSESESSNLNSKLSLGTDKIEKSDSTDAFINSICTENLTILASNAYAENYGIPVGVIHCAVSQNPRTGSHNVFYLAEFSENGGARTRKWMIRIPLKGRSFGNAEKLWLESDIRSMEFIKERTGIPIPYIYGYDHSTDNIIGTSYVLMDFMEGDRVEDVWENWNDEKRMVCLSGCAESMRKLGRFGFNKIGVLGCDHKKGEYIVHGIPSNTGDKLAGPFPCTKAYLDTIWRTKAIEIGRSISPEAVKEKQFLLLLKLLIPVLVDLGLEKNQYFLSLPRLGGKNVLVDGDGNITGFVGWEKVMIMPKAMGYAKYPEWIIKDWTSLQEQNPIATEQPETKINHKPLTKASLNSGKTIDTVKDNKGVIHGYLLGEGEKIPGKTVLNPTTSAPSSLFKFCESEDKTKVNDILQIADSQDGVTHLPNTILLDELASIPSPTNPPALKSGQCVESGRSKKHTKGRNGGSKNNNRGGNRRNNHGSKFVARQRQEYEYDEDTELRSAITDADKTKVHAVSKWNALPEEMIRKEADERGRRKLASLAKGEEDNISGVKKDTPMLPKVVETFKKVVVEHNLERKLLEIVKTERKDPQDGPLDMENTKIYLPQTPKPSDAVRYRKIYHGFFTRVSPEDGMATKFSHIPTAVHIAITDNDIRSSIVPRLARHVFGTTVGPNLLGMVGSGQWANELLSKLTENTDEPKSEGFAGEGGQVGVEDEGKMEVGDGTIWELLVLGPTLAVGVVVMIFGVALIAAWVFGLGKYHLQSAWHENRYTTMINLSFRLESPLVQTPAPEVTGVISYFLGDILGKVTNIIILTLNSCLTLIGVVVLFVAVLKM